MLLTDPGLGRRIQLQQGLVWLAAAQGDPCAALLRGLDTDPREYWRRLAERPLDRSATGAWVTARHAVASRAAAEPALCERPLLDGFGPSAADGTPQDRVPADGGDDPVIDVEQAWHRALAAVPAATGGDGGWDVVAVARAAAVEALALAWGLDADGRLELSAAVELTGGLLDASCYPQNLADTRRIARGVTALRALPAVGGSEERVLLAAVGVRMATDLVVNTLVRYPEAMPRQDLEALWARLRAEPGGAARAVAETLRWAGPVQLRTLVAQAPCELAGQRIEPGEEVVILLGAANRDAEAFTDPDRYDPDRFAAAAPDRSDPVEAARAARVLLPGAPSTRVLSFAAACAHEGLSRLAVLRPRPDGTGAPARRAAAPVSRSLLSFAARTPLS
ncbi:cytochrome P450 [Kitasatospora sp. NPDC001664]